MQLVIKGKIEVPRHLFAIVYIANRNNAQNHSVKCNRESMIERKMEEE